MCKQSKKIATGGYTYTCSGNIKNKQQNIFFIYNAQSDGVKKYNIYIKNKVETNDHTNKSFTQDIYRVKIINKSGNCQLHRQRKTSTFIQRIYLLFTYNKM